jgi:predicted transcriptional regulator
LENAFIFMAINESGYTQQEVASILDISQVAVQKRLKNTTQKIRKKGL